MQVVNDSDPRVTPSQNGITYVESEMILMIAMISWMFRRLNGLSSSYYCDDDNHYHLWVLPAGWPATGRLARGKRLVFRNQGHHHHVRRSLI